MSQTVKAGQTMNMNDTMNTNDAMNSTNRCFDRMKQFANKLRGQNGFTLVELVVTIVILLIASVSVTFGITQWISYSRMKKQNEYARSLFVAAQNQLSVYSVSGELEDMQDYFSRHTEYKIDPYNGTLISSEGEAYTKELWTGAGAKVTGDIYSVILTASDYQGYESDASAFHESYRKSDPAKWYIYEMLVDYLYDPSILSANICIEFTPSDGQVFSVLYNGDNKEISRFTYGEADGPGAIQIRTASKRRANGYIGYYGVDTLSRATSNKVERPSVNKLSLNNEETLNLTYKIGKVDDQETAIHLLNYQLSIFETSTKRELLRLEYAGKDILNTVDLQTQDAPAVSCKVTQYTYTEDGVKSEYQYPDPYNFLIWCDNSYVIHAVLDAVDLDADSSLLLDTLPYLYPASDGGEKLKSADQETREKVNRMMKTYSLHRFGIPVENIYCSVQASGDGTEYKDSLPKQSRSDNAYFAADSGLTKDSAAAGGQTESAVYRLKNGRHLHNIRYAEDYSDAELTSQDAELSGVAALRGNLKICRTDEQNEALAADRTIYELENDISWIEQCKNAIFASQKNMCLKEQAVETGFVFPSLKCLQEKSVLRSSTSTNEAFVISGLQMTVNNNETYHVYDTDAQTDEADMHPVGLFLTNQGMLQNIRTQDCQAGEPADSNGHTGHTNHADKTETAENSEAVFVNSAEYVGIFCGQNAGVLSGLESGESNQVFGYRYVGGIAGGQIAEETAEQMRTERTNPFLIGYGDLVNRGAVTGVRCVGGIIGAAEGNSSSEVFRAWKQADDYESDEEAPEGLTPSTIVMSECRNYGLIQACEQSGDPEKDANAAGQNAGGSGSGNADGDQQQKENARFIGGIIGYAGAENTASDRGLIICSCTNSPQGNEESLSEIADDLVKNGNQKLNGVYVGGIAGYVNGAVLRGCSTYNEDGKQGFVTGYRFVGGIAGFYATKEEALNGNGIAEPGNEAHIVGDSYVGGIVGCNAAFDASKDGADYDPLSAENIEYPWNDETDTFSEIYVTGTKKQDGVIPEAGEGISRITGWLNTGCIISYADYAGGITGYNSGVITDCSCKAETEAGTEKLAEKKTINYIGGIAGYNSGIIAGQNTSRKDAIEVVCNIAGTNFVGGIVGYNDVDALIDGYAVAGGTIRGTGSFIGGFAGVNASSEAVKDKKSLGSSPRVLTGEFAVGGTFGANVVALSSQELYDAEYRTNNFLGNLSAKAFAGGFIGYNNAMTLKEDLTPETSDDWKMLLRGALYAKADVLQVCVKEYEAASDAAGRERVLKNAISAMASFNTYKTEQGRAFGDYLKAAEALYQVGQNETPAAGYMVIDGIDAATVSKLEGIHTELYGGGVIGYNEEESRLLIRNVNNLSPVAVRMSIDDLEDQEPGQSEQRKTYQGNPYRYSYGGGIMGRVTRLAIIESCGNRDTANVDTAGTYEGGIAEINEGIVRKCTVKSTGSSNRDYVGGAVGLNRASGIVTNCSMNGETVTGRYYVGGIVSENYGKISNCSFRKASVTATGKNTKTETAGSKTAGNGMAGGAAAVNYGSGQIICAEGSADNLKAGTAAVSRHPYGKYEDEEKQTFSAAQVSITVRGSGNCIGGIVGYNLGTLEGRSQDAEVDFFALSSEGSVAGNRYVGGFVGLNENGGIDHVLNYASVTAENGDVGGIVGEVSFGQVQTEAQITEQILSCSNYGAVTAVKANHAGGIVGYNASDISFCNDFGVVSSSNGICAGITAENSKDGTIEDCYVGPEKEQEQLQFVGLKYAGGVSGINAGVIRRSDAAGITLENTLSGSQAYLGGITGISGENALISECGVGRAGQEVIIQASLTDTSQADLVLGGVAGENSGIITGMDSGDVSSAEKHTEVYASLGFKQTAFFGNIGGICGVNNGTVQYYTFSGTVEGTANNPRALPDYNPNIELEKNICGYGGIVGKNMTDNGRIDHCEVNTASITGVGDANNIANIGGIAGYNGLKAKITNVRIGEGETKDKKMYLTASTDTFYKEDFAFIRQNTANVYVGTKNNTAAYAHCGGVAGLNSGTISDIYVISEEQKAEEIAGMSELEQKQLGTEYSFSYMFSEAVDSSGVFIENNCGHVGGIAGYNRQSGRIDRVATGNRWFVYAVSNAQDNGCGGIIGYNTSEGGLSYCFNRASVLKAKAGSNAVGGLVGRLEASAVQQYQILRCVNYGRISGNERVAGLLGCVKYYMGTVSQCINYGTINEKNARGAAGIIAYFYRAQGQVMNIVGCENHGIINSNNGGGIIGNFDNGGLKLKTILDNCVNTGRIKKAGNNSGIIGGSTGLYSGLESGSKVVNCRNYGAALGGANEALPGLLPGNFDTQMVMSAFDCFSFGGNPNIAPKSNVDNSFSLDSEGSANVGGLEFYVKEIEVQSSWKKSSEEHLKQIVTEPANGGAPVSTRFYLEKINNISPATTYTFTFLVPMELESIDLYFYRAVSGGRVQRTQNYTIEYFDGTEWKTYAECMSNIPADKKSLTYNGNDPTDMDHDIITSDIRTAAGEPETVLAKAVRVVIDDSRDRSGNLANICLYRFRPNGTVDGIPYQGLKDGYQGTYTYSGTTVFYTFTEGLTSAMNGGKAIFSQSGETVKQVITKPYDRISGKYQLVLNRNNSRRVGIPGFDFSLLNDIYQLQGDAAYTSVEEVMADSEAAKDDLAALGNEKSNARYLLFLAVDPYLSPTISAGEVSNAAPSVPEVTSITKQAAVYSAEWKAAAQAEYYQYQVEFCDGDPAQGGTAAAMREGVVYTTSMLFSADPALANTANYIRIRVRAGRRNMAEDGSIGVNWSEWSDWKSPDLQKIQLPTPVYHLELNSKLEYEIYVDNMDAYRALNTDLKNIQLSVWRDTSKTTITLDQADNRYGKSGKTISVSASTGNVNFIAKAEPVTLAANLFDASEEARRESMCPGITNYSGEKQFAYITLEPNNASNSNTSTGFKGDTAETLHYDVQLKVNGIILYYNSELLAVDQAIGVPVALSQADLRVSDVNGSDYIRVSLNQLPESIAGILSNPQNITDYDSPLLIRSYPLKISNDVIFMGHTAGQGYSAEQLLNDCYVDKSVMRIVTDTDREPDGEYEALISETADGKRKVADGFEIRLIGPDQYEVYYNALLEQNAMLGKEYPNTGEGTYEDAVTTQNSYQVFYYKYSNQMQRVKQPEITIEPQYETNGDVGQLMIFWDAHTDSSGLVVPEKEAEKAVYDYKIIGVMADGTETQLDTKSGTGEHSILFTDTSSWNYQMIRAEVTRRGEVNKNNGVTSTLPNSNTEVFLMKPRFSQIMAPSISLTKDQDGKTQKDSLLYQISWSAVPEVQNPEGADALDHYRISVSGSETYQQGLSEEEAKAKLKELSETEFGLYKEWAGAQAVFTEESETEWKLTWIKTDAEQSMESEWTMLVRCEEDPDEAGTFRLVKELSSIISVKADPEADQTTVSRVLDLNYYDDLHSESALEGCTIRASVCAVAVQAEDVAFRSGNEGVAREMQMPVRLRVPQDPSADTPLIRGYASGKYAEYDANSALTMDEFEKTYQLRLDNPAAETAEGKYEIAAAVYEKAPDQALQDTVEKIQTGNDEAENGTAGLWNSGAVKTLTFKTDDTHQASSMSGNLKSASYKPVSALTGITTDDAGKYIKLALHEVADNWISSEWTDEDETSQNTKDYWWIRIPRLQLRTPEMSMGSTSLKYAVKYDVNQVSGGWMEYDPTVEDEKATVFTQPVVKINTVDYAETYLIKRVRTPEYSQVMNDGMLYGIQDADWFTIRFADENTMILSYVSSNRDAKSVDELSLEPDRVYRLQMNEKEIVNAYPTEIYTGISWTKQADGSAQISVILPDISAADSAAGDVISDPINKTGMLSVQALPEDQDPSADGVQNDAYASSRLASEGHFSDGSWKLSEYAQETSAEEMEITCEVSELTGVRAELISSANVVYRIQSSGQTGYRYMGCYLPYDRNGQAARALISDQFLAEGENSMIVSYACITASGLSKWSAPIKVDVPVKPAKEIETETEASEADQLQELEQLQYYDAVTGEWRADGQKREGDAEVHQRSLSFRLENMCSEYSILQIREPENDPEKGQIRYADWIILKKDPQGMFDVYYDTTDPGQMVLASDQEHKTSLPEEHPDASYLGTLTGQNAVELPQYAQMYFSTDGRQKDASYLSSFIQWTVGDPNDEADSYFSWLLPDVTETAPYGNVTFDGVSLVSAVCADTERSEMIWRKNIFGETEKLFQKEKEKADQTVSFMLETSELEDEAWELSLFTESDLLLQVELYQKQSLTSVRYLSMYAEEKQNKRQLRAYLPRQLTENVTDQQMDSLSLRVRFAQITDESDEEFGGLTEWSDWIDFRRLPVPAVLEMETEMEELNLEGLLEEDDAVQDDASQSGTAIQEEQSGDDMISDGTVISEDQNDGAATFEGQQETVDTPAAEEIPSDEQGNQGDDLIIG